MQPAVVVDANRAPYDVWVGRGGPFGNPIKPGLTRCLVCNEPHATGAATLPCYARRLACDPAFRRQALALRGRVLGCPCGQRGGMCHGIILANLIHHGDQLV